MTRLVWTRERPTEPGWYRFRALPSAHVGGTGCIQVYRHRDTEVCMDPIYCHPVPDGYEWCRIPEPEEDNAAEQS